jgi:hypothetical protein
MQTCQKRVNIFCFRVCAHFFFSDADNDTRGFFFRETKTSYYVSISVGVCSITISFYIRMSTVVCAQRIGGKTTVLCGLKECAGEGECKLRIDRRMTTRSMSRRQATVSVESGLRRSAELKRTVRTPDVVPTHRKKRDVEHANEEEEDDEEGGRGAGGGGAIMKARIQETMEAKENVDQWKAVSKLCSQIEEALEEVRELDAGQARLEKAHNHAQADLKSNVATAETELEDAKTDIVWMRDELAVWRVARAETIATGATHQALKAMDDLRAKQEHFALSAGPEFKDLDAIERKEYGRIRRDAVARKLDAMRMTAEEWKHHIAQQQRKKAYHQRAFAEQHLVDTAASSGPDTIAATLNELSNIEETELRIQLLDARLLKLRSVIRSSETGYEAWRQKYLTRKHDRLNVIANYKRAISAYNIEYASEEAADVKRNRCFWILRKTAAAIRNLEALQASSR